MSAPAFATKPPSRLTLGTVQLGMNYGVANRTGRPDYGAVVEILKEADRAGIDTIDTAATYGGSEEWLGRALRELGLRDRMRVVTKIAPIDPDLSPKEAGRQIEASLVDSLKKLALDRVAACMFHRDANLRYFDELLALRARGLIDLAGVSMNKVETAREALKLPEVKIWQIPANVLDRRFTDPSVAMKAVRSGVVIFARSAYLQGLLLMDDQSTPPHLREVIPSRRALRDIAMKFGMSLRELIFRAMISRPDIHSIVVGVETLEQTKENIAMMTKGPLPAEAYAAIESYVPDVPDWLVVPANWEHAARGQKPHVIG